MILFSRIVSLLTSLVLMGLYIFFHVYYYILEPEEKYILEDLIVSIVILLLALLIGSFVIMTWKFKNNQSGEFLLDEIQHIIIKRRWYIYPLAILNALVAVGSIALFSILFMENKKEYIHSINYGMIDLKLIIPLSLITFGILFGVFHIYYVYQMLRFYRQKTQ